MFLSGLVRRTTPSALLALTLAVAAGCTGGEAAPSVQMVTPVTPAPLGVRDTAYDPPKPAPVLRLTDQDGRPFELTTLQGGPVFVYFGYTHCPDVCPTTLADLRAAITTAGIPAKVVFVTIDPARDTPGKMKQYVDFYAAGFIGLSGTDTEVATAAKAWGVGYMPGPTDSIGNYPMTHTTESYLVDQAGLLRNHIFFGAPTSLIVSILRTATGG
jgi:protein SCO1/2